MPRSGSSITVCRTCTRQGLGHQVGHAVVFCSCVRFCLWRYLMTVYLENTPLFTHLCRCNKQLSRLRTFTAFPLCMCSLTEQARLTHKALPTPLPSPRLSVAGAQEQGKPHQSQHWQKQCVEQQRKVSACHNRRAQDSPGPAHGVDSNTQHIQGMEVYSTQQEEPKQG